MFEIILQAVQDGLSSLARRKEMLQRGPPGQRAAIEESLGNAIRHLDHATQRAFQSTRNKLAQNFDEQIRSFYRYRRRLGDLIAKGIPTVTKLKYIFFNP